MTHRLRFFCVLAILLNTLFELSSSEFNFFRRKESLSPIAGKTVGVEVNDSSLVNRIVTAYRLSCDLESRGNSMWQSIFDQRHIAIHQVFKSGQIDQASAILRNPARTDFFYGIDNLAQSISPILDDPVNAHSYATSCLDGLIRFAEAIGAVRFENPEHYHFTPPYVWEGDAIISKIEEALRKPISFPNPYPFEHGLLTSKGVVSFRAPQALYQAWRIKELLKGKHSPRVLEIGAGVGRTAYYAYKLGIKDYTIIDLPLTLTASGYFLGLTLGENKVLLNGESAPDSKKRVKLLNPSDFLNGNNHYDLIINVDSMTEIDPSIAQAYWNKIEESTDIFLSINHEQNPFTVKNLIDSSKRTNQVDRMPYWMRYGYIEETVRFQK